MNKKNILFIHHGSHDGGAPLSMLYTMRGARENGYSVIAGLLNPSTKLHALYNDEGFQTVELPEIPRFLTWSGSEGRRFNPITWLFIFQALLKWNKGQKQLQEAIAREKVDLVHLNSASLSNCALLLNRIDFPFVWHVREHGPNHKGMRFRRISKNLQDSKEVIFLSEAEKRSWVAKIDHGTVVHNFIDFEKFKIEKYQDKNKVTESHVKKVLFVGGLHKHKGIETLIEALHHVKQQFDGDFRCIMPASKISLENQNNYHKEILSLIKSKGLEKTCVLLPFSSDIVDLFAICDLLVFPANVPHFARPVIEASAMKRPVIASDLPAIDELVITDKTGYLVDYNKSELFAEKILHLFRNPTLANEMGENGYAFAKENFEYRSQMQKILNIYRRLLN